MATAALASLPKFTGDLAEAVNRPARQPGVCDQTADTIIFTTTRSVWIAYPCAVSTTANAKDSTHCSQPELLQMLTHVLTRSYGKNPSICRICPNFSTPPSMRCLGILSAFRGGPGQVRQGFRLDSELCDNAESVTGIGGFDPNPLACRVTGRNPCRATEKGWSGLEIPGTRL